MARFGRSLYSGDTGRALYSGTTGRALWGQGDLSTGWTAVDGDYRWALGVYESPNFYPTAPPGDYGKAVIWPLAVSNYSDWYEPTGDESTDISGDIGYTTTGAIWKHLVAGTTYKTRCTARRSIWIEGINTAAVGRFENLRVTFSYYGDDSARGNLRISIYTLDTEDGDPGSIFDLENGLIGTPDGSSPWIMDISSVPVRKTLFVGAYMVGDEPPDTQSVRDQFRWSAEYNYRRL